MSTTVVVKRLRRAAATSGPAISVMRGRRAHDQPVDEAALDVARQRHAGVDAGEAGAHDQGERDREAPGTRRPRTAGSSEMPRKAPDVATRMKSGMTSDGRNTDGIRRTRIRLRQASPALTASACLTTSPPAGAGTPRSSPPPRRRASPSTTPSPISVGRGLDALDDQVAHRLDQVRDRVDVGDGPEPAGHGLAGEERRREEQQHEEEGEGALDGLGRAGAQRQDDPQPAHGDGHQGGQHQQDQHAGDAALDPGAEDDADRQEEHGLGHRQRHPAAQAAGQDRECARPARPPAGRRSRPRCPARRPRRRTCRRSGCPARSRRPGRSRGSRAPAGSRGSCPARCRTSP